MREPWLILLLSFGYLGLLFGIAFWGDRRAEQGRSVIANPWIYSLSLAVYATSWTYYGSVGRAAASGAGFLPVYLGPTLAAVLWWSVLRKMIRIARANRTTTIADFIAARYGSSRLLAGLVTVIAVIGLIPYIALQLKAVSASFALLTAAPQAAAGDSALYVALALAAFTIVFGTRHLDATERHEGMVAAIAFESLVKLGAFLAVGAFVTWGIYDGFADIFRRAAADPKLAALTGIRDESGGYASWTLLTLLSGLAVLMLPRQFQVGVVENVDEEHVRRATWLFPAYMLAINLFVLPIAFGGLLTFAGQGVDADTFVLSLPLAHGQTGLALLVFIGGLSAATGMVIVETIALSTMICNDLALPLLLRAGVLAARSDLSGVLLGIRRAAIVLLMVLGYAYYRVAGEAYALVAIGLVSFAAVAQFAPPMLGGMYWKGGTRAGAQAGLAAGFAVWLYTLLLPSFAKSGWLSPDFVEHGLGGLAFTKPQALFGLTGLDPISHAVFWSLTANVAAYAGVSLMRRPDAREHAQAVLFVDAFRLRESASALWRGHASPTDLAELLRRYLGPLRAESLLADFAQERGLASAADLEPDARLVEFVQAQLAGAIGAASARILVESVVQEEALTPDEVMNILDEASQVIAYSRRLEEQSRALEAASAELAAANRRLEDLDRLKDDFVATVSHELRTPLTSIRALTEILRDDPDMDPEQRQEFLEIIVKDTERLSRLINDMLDLGKIESGRMQWNIEEVELAPAVEEAVSSLRAAARERGVQLTARLPEGLPLVSADRDRLVQVLVNLIGNALKFAPRDSGRVTVAASRLADAVRVDVRDNGPGIRREEQDLIFEKFRQAGDTLTGKPQGTGLGLPISRQIVNHFGGRLWVESEPGRGATFSFTLPFAAGQAAEAARQAGAAL